MKILILVLILLFENQIWAQNFETRIREAHQRHQMLLSQGLQSLPSCSLNGEKSPLISIIQNLRFENIKPLDKTLRSCIGGVAQAKGKDSPHKVLGFYNEASDTIFVDPELSSVVFYLVLTHELTHREWARDPMRMWLTQWSLNLYTLSYQSKRILDLAPSEAREISLLAPSLTNELISFLASNCLLEAYQKNGNISLNEEPIARRIYSPLKGNPILELHNLSQKISGAYAEGQNTNFFDYSTEHNSKKSIDAKTTPSTLLIEKVVSNPQPFPLRTIGILGDKFTGFVAQDIITTEVRPSLENEIVGSHKDSLPKYWVVDAKDPLHVTLNKKLKKDLRRKLNWLDVKSCLPTRETIFVDDQNPIGTEGIHNDIDLFTVGESYPFIDIGDEK